jgi:hypothetical protein
MRVLVALALVAVASPAPAATKLGARLLADRVEAGSTATLLVTVTDPEGNVGDPQLDVPDGIELLGTSRSTNFTWVNGRSTTEVSFRVALSALDPGRYAVGPIRVTVGRQTFVGGTNTLVVVEGGAGAIGSGPRGAATGTARNASGAASLIVDIEPREPWVGQLCRLTVRLVQRVTMSEDSQYDSPATPGFWTEGWSDPVQYESREGSRPVLVVERHQRLYPLAAGSGRIGPARGLVSPVGGLPSLVGGARGLELASPPVPVRVRSLPPGAPAGFDGGVGAFTVAWWSDRSHTTEDQPVTVTLDVRGTGNLPLLRTPKLAGPELEVFGTATDDSLAPAGALAPGRRRFSWTILPRRRGAVRVEPPAFAWFDPATATYRSASPPAIELQVASASAAPAEEDGFPRVFGEHRPAPGSRPARPWAFMLGGFLAGVAWQLVRHARSASADAPERARQREWLRAVGLARGPDFWRAADEAAAWAEARGQRVMRIREEVAAARFGGRSVEEDDLRRRLVERLAEALPLEPARGTSWVLSGMCVLVAAALLALGWPGGGDARLAGRVAAADGAAREGRLEPAMAEWQAVWRRAPDPDVAARLAWAAQQGGRTGEAAGWVLAGQSGEPRRPALRWIADRVRESGGLVGQELRPVPLASWEWGALACALALGAAMEWPRRRWSVPLALLALLAAAAGPLQSRLIERPPQRAIARETPMEDAGVVLQPGQVVRVLGSRGSQLRVRAARDAEGLLDPAALSPPEPR